METKKQLIEIDATDQILGRLATKIAAILLGKNKVTFIPYLVMGDQVLVKNIAKMKVTGNKMEDKKYYHHTGYPGALKIKAMKDLLPKEVLFKAVYNMLPKNKLRKLRMQNLIIQ